MGKLLVKTGLIGVIVCTLNVNDDKFIATLKSLIMPSRCHRRKATVLVHMFVL